MSPCWCPVLNRVVPCEQCNDSVCYQDLVIYATENNEELTGNELDMTRS